MEKYIDNVSDITYLSELILDIFDRRVNFDICPYLKMSRIWFMH